MPSIDVRLNEQIESFWNRIQEVESQDTDKLTRLQTCILTSREFLIHLRQWVTAHPFPDKDSEIYFFKWVKPQILGRYIFYCKIYHLHIGYFNGNELLEKERWEKELRMVERFFTDNKDFYTYYRTECTHNDEVYFLRGIQDWKISPEVYRFDDIFCTYRDEELAKVIAYELLLKYLAYKLIVPVADNTVTEVKRRRPKWTDSKVDLVELVYSMFAKGSFDNGTALLKDLIDLCSTAFQFDLKDYTQSHQKARERKSNETKFLDELKDSLKKYNDRLDERKD